MSETNFGTSESGGNRKEFADQLIPVLNSKRKFFCSRNVCCFVDNNGKYGDLITQSTNRSSSCALNSESIS